MLPEYSLKIVELDGAETPTWVPAVYPNFPDFRDYSTESMLKAGVDPGSIHVNTQSGDRLDGGSTVAAFAAEAESILNSSE